ncbi:ATP-binding cassette domain-containing protein [Granulicatella adiacens]
MGYMKKILGWLPRKYLLLIAIGMSLTALDGIIIPSFISGLIDVSATQKVEDLIKISMIGILSFSLIRLGLFIWEDSQQKMIKQVTLSLKEKVITAFFYGKFNQQEVESIVLSELKLLEEQGIKSIMGFFYCLVFALVTLLYVSAIDLKLAALFITLSFLPVLVPKLFAKSIRKHSKEWAEVNQLSILQQQEYLKSKPIIKNFFVEKIFLNKLMGTLNQTEEAYFQMNHVRFTSKLLANLLSGLSSFVPLAIGVYLVIVGETKLATVIAIYLASDRIVSPLLNAIDYYQRFNSIIPVIERVEKYTEFEWTHLESKSSISTVFPIELKECTVQIDGMTILKKINIEMNGNDRILIMGPSGSGKSTLLELLYGVHVSEVGVQKYNGVHRQLVSGDDLKKHIGFFTQESRIFYESLKFNLSLGEDYSDSEVTSVLQKVGLGYLVDRLGLHNSEVNLDESLSGGEKARICLGRLLLRKYQLLLLDEFSSAIDEDTTMMIRELLIKDNIPFIEIAHRVPKNIHVYNKQYTLESGELTLN